MESFTYPVPDNYNHRNRRYSGTRSQGTRRSDTWSRPPSCNRLREKENKEGEERRIEKNQLTIQHLINIESLLSHLLRENEMSRLKNIVVKKKKKKIADYDE